MIKFSCKNCGQKLNVDDKHSGRQVKCPKCGVAIVVPANSDKITFHCKSCGQKISVPQIHAGKKGKCPKCQNAVVIPGGKAAPAQSRPSNSIPPQTQQNQYPEESEETQESEGVNVRLILMISGAALVLVAGLIVLAVVLRPSGQQPDVPHNQEVVANRGSQPKLVTSNTPAKEPDPAQVKQETANKGQPPKYIDYIAELNKLGMAGHSENDNAAPLYQKASELNIRMPSELSNLIPKEWPANFPTREQQQLLRQWVQSNSEALSQLELASHKPYFWFKMLSPRSPLEISYVKTLKLKENVFEGMVFGSLSPNLSDYRNLCFALISRAKLSVVEGNNNKAIVDIMTCYRIGMQLQTGGPKSVTEQLVGIAIRALAIQAAFDILDRTKPNKDFLQSLQSQIEELSTEEGYIPDFRSDKFMLLDFIQRIFTDDGKGDGQFIDSMETLAIMDIFRAMSVSTDNLIAKSDLLKALSRRQTTETLEKHYQYIDTLSRKSPWQLKSENADWMKIAKENMLVEALDLSTEKTMQVFARCRAETEGLITTLAVLRYKAEKGQLPSKLDELVTAGYLKTLPSDPFSGKPFIYKLTNKENFTLYSFGLNLTDDGGKTGLSPSTKRPTRWADDGDAVFWPVLK